jgi:hypothetical protein
MISLEQFLSQLNSHNIFENKSAIKLLMDDSIRFERMKNDENLISVFLDEYKRFKNKYGSISFSIENFYDENLPENSSHNGYKPEKLPQYYTITWRFRF